MSTVSPSPAPTAPSSVRKVIVASFIGTSIEWYDFFLYGTAAALVFHRLFFPTLDPLAGTMACLRHLRRRLLRPAAGRDRLRPLGDQIGRKSMLVATLLLMGLATFLIGLLPTYAQVGVLAPVLLVVLRFVQGLGVGGEWGGAVLLVEHGPPGRRGFYASGPGRVRRRPPAGQRRARRSPPPPRGGVPQLGLAGAVPAGGGLLVGW